MYVNPVGEVCQNPSGEIMFVKYDSCDPNHGGHIPDSRSDGSGNLCDTILIKCFKTDIILNNDTKGCNLHGEGYCRTNGNLGRVGLLNSIFRYKGDVNNNECAQF